MRAFQGKNQFFQHFLITLLALCLVVFTFFSAAAGTSLPPAPVTAWAANQQITLSWKKVGDATGFRIYRSYVSSKDYELAAEVPAGPGVDYAFHDTGLINSVTYYYVLTTLDGSGSESGYSSEVAEMPAPQVTSATLLNAGAYPRHGSAPLLVAANLHFENDILPPEPAPWLMSQVRLGSISEPPSAWTQITPAFISGFSAQDRPLTAVSAVYPDSLTPETQIYYVFCFSTNAGRTWTYFGQHGRLADPTQIQLKDNLGLIPLIPPPSSDPLSQPGTPVLVSNAPDAVFFSWTPSTGLDTLLGYDIYRSGPGDDAPRLVARVPAAPTQYKDTGLRPHTAYTYTVRAVDNAFQESLPSPGAVLSTTGAEPVAVTIQVTIPAVSPGDIFINRGVDANHLPAGLDWQSQRMTCDRQKLFCSASLSLQEGSLYAFSISRGSADTLQTLPDGNTPAPESAFVVRGVNSTMIFHTIVYQWDDPLVVGYSPSGSEADRRQPITVVWNQAMSPDTKFIIERKVGDHYSPVSGTFHLSADQRTVIFDPVSYLSNASTYRVQVSNQEDAYKKPQQIPFTWEFTTSPIHLLLPLIFHSS